MEEYKVYEKKSKVLPGLMVGIIIFAAGVFAAAYFDRWYTTLFGSLLALFTFFFNIPIIAKFFRKTPVLIISSEGVEEKSSNSSLGLIRWRDIEKVGLVKFKGQDNIGIVIKNMKEYKKKLSPRQKAGLELNRKNHQPHVSMSFATTDKSCAEVYGVLKEFYGKYHR